MAPSPSLPLLPPGRHPLDATDRPLVDALLLTGEPSDGDITTAARLIIRYRDSVLSPDLVIKLRQALNRWGLTEDQLMVRSRVIWASGWRPAPVDQPAEVGSGADVEG